MTAPARHRTIGPTLGPAWQTGGEAPDDGNESALVRYALDIVTDAVEEAAFQSMMVRFPQQDPGGTPAPPNALAAMGRDRRVVRGINESADSFARRLKSWLTDRRTAGNPFTLMQKIAEYAGDGTVKVRTVDRRGNWFTREADGTRTYVLNEANWNWDGSLVTLWSKFWVIIYPNGIWEEGPAIGDGVVDDGALGATWTRDQVATVRFLVADWKPQGTRCVNIILAFDPASFDPTAPEPDGLWGNYSKVAAGTRVRSRLATARYMKGTS